MPGTITPYPGDYFIMKIINTDCLFRIEEINVTQIDNNSSYTISFSLKEENIDINNFFLTDLIISKYVFEYRHTGTQYRTIFTKAEHNSINILIELYNEIGKIFHDEFYDDVLNTFILNYTGKDLPEIQSATNVDTYVSPNSIGYFNCSFYDDEVIQFIKNENIFAHVNKNPIIPTSYSVNKERKSSNNNTLFKGVLNKTKSIELKHHMPVEFKYDTPGITPILYGKTFIYHVSNIADGCFSLYPPNIVPIIQNLNGNILNHRENHYNHIYEFIVEIIAHYINKYDDIIMNKLLFLYELLENLQSYNFKFKEFMFYLYPIIGYIIKEKVKKISYK